MNESGERIENFTWTGTVIASKAGRARLQLQANDRDSGTNFRQIAEVEIEDLISPQLGRIADQLMGDFVRAHQAR